MRYTDCLQCTDFDGKAITCMLTRTTVPYNEQHICPTPDNCPKNKKKKWQWLRRLWKKIKKLHLSRTFWVTFFGVIAQVINLTQKWIPVDIAIVIQGLITIILRVITGKSLEEK